MANPRPVQQQLVGNEVTQPKLDELLALFKNRISDLKDTTEADLDRWLQSHGGGCEKRAQDLALELKPKDMQVMPPQPNLTKVADWESVKKSLDKNVPVRVKNRDTFIGGEDSRFGGAHHVVLFVAYDNAGGDKGPAYFVGYDPDVTATAATKKAWEDLGGPLPGPPKGLDAARRHNFISEMVVPNSTLGTLFRKYFVDVSKPFPKYDPLADFRD